MPTSDHLYLEGSLPGFSPARLPVRPAGDRIGRSHGNFLIHFIRGDLSRRLRLAESRMERSGDV